MWCSKYLGVIIKILEGSIAIHDTLINDDLRK